MTTSSTSMIGSVRTRVISKSDRNSDDESVHLTWCFYRYLILDILGQGTFGQVVKCQNMKTHEVVAVKVVKNKPAYFNQSMMEVTILELVCYVLPLGAWISEIEPISSTPAQLSMWSPRWASHLAPPRFVHPQKPSLSRIWAIVVQPLRTHQAKPVPGIEYAASEGVHGTTARCFDSPKRSAADTLRS